MGMAGIAVAILANGSAYAQSAPSVGVEATTDEARRGLSWSGGKASVSGDLSANIGPVEASARVAALRGSARHGGSDAVADLGVGTRWDVADLTFGLRAIGHVFAGARGSTDYGEVMGAVGYTYGPVQLQADATYAPKQDAIGGSNLYLHADAVVGVPSTPFTIVAGLGRSSGKGDGTPRADRLRPGGDYVDWRLSAEHVRGPLVLAIDYIGTDIDAGALRSGAYGIRHDGDRVLGRVRYSF